MSFILNGSHTCIAVFDYFTAMAHEMNHVQIFISDDLELEAKVTVSRYFKEKVVQPILKVCHVTLILT